MAMSPDALPTPPSSNASPVLMSPPQASPARIRQKYRLRIDHDENDRPRIVFWVIAIGWGVSILIHVILIINLMLINLQKEEDTGGIIQGETIDTALAMPDRIEGLDEPLITIPPPEPEKPKEPETSPLLIAPPPPPLAFRPSLETPAPVVAEPDGKAGEENGDAKAFGAAKFGVGKETVQGVSVRVGDPQFTLLWDSDADLDLHVEEPSGSHLYWADRRGAQGGELDVDDTNGFGPENIYWNVKVADGQDQTTPGTGPVGVYRWYVKYYQGFAGESKKTRWKVRVKHNSEVQVFEGTLKRIGEKSETRTLTIEPGIGSGAQ